MNETTKTLMREYANLHNRVMLREVEKNELLLFIQQNKNEMNHANFLQIFSEEIELFSEEYYLENKEMCEFIYELWNQNKDSENVSHFGLRTLIRLGVFEDEFSEILQNGKLLKNNQ